MRKNIAYLNENGPSTSDELPYNIGPADKMHGARVFKLTSATKTKVGGMVTPIYYLDGEHSETDVLRAFLDENPQLVEALARSSLHRMIGGHGGTWRSIAPDVTSEFYETDDASSAPSPA
jgi:hypothetical protein